jgi:hypothetical protein
MTFRIGRRAFITLLGGRAAVRGAAINVIGSWLPSTRPRLI